MTATQTREVFLLYVFSNYKIGKINQTNEKKINVIFSDSLYSIIALVIMNMVAQFGMYPFWAKQLGTEHYGNILYLLSFINIFAVSVGSALNFSRLADSAKF